jgi:hypothetical protein
MNSSLRVSQHRCNSMGDRRDPEPRGIIEAGTRRRDRGQCRHRRSLRRCRGTARFDLTLCASPISSALRVKLFVAGMAFSDREAAFAVLPGS